MNDKSHIKDGPRARVISLLCAGFLVSSLVWLLMISPDFRTLSALLLFLPQYLCADWLGRRIFNKDSKWSVKNSPSAGLRTAVGILIVIVLLAVTLTVREMYSIN